MLRLAALGKVISLLASRVSAPAGSLLLQQLLAGVVAMLILSVIAALLTGALIIVASYAAYAALIANGMAPGVAQASLGVLLLLLIAGLAVAITVCARKIQHNSSHMLVTPDPLAARVTGVANAFFDGLLAPRLK